MEEKRLKISVLCASRGNVDGLRFAIGSFDALSSKNHDIDYMIACDIDDPDILSMGIPNAAFVANNRGSLGGKWNDISTGRSSDIYALVTDRTLCLTPSWDIYLADAYNQDSRRVLWWTTNAGPVIPIVSRAWLEAAGQLYTGYFPFWFDDTWLHELSAMVFGLPNYMVEANCFIYKKNPMTKRLRDLRFWMNFFIAKRPERLAHAEKIREKFGLLVPAMKPINDWMKSNDEMWNRDWQKWQDVMGDKSEPDETYIAAKKSAEEFMNEQRP